MAVLNVIPPKPPLLRLPIELLAMILNEYIRMDLPLTLLMTMPQSLRTGSTMACATEKFLQTCIQRAHNSPLEATFVVGRIDESSPTPELRRARFQMLMSRSSQISFLCLIINPNTPLPVIKDSFHDLFNASATFPALESLMIYSAIPVPGLLKVFRPLLDQLERTTVKLRSVYFENVTEEFILAAREYKFWRKLCRITIKGEYSPLHVTAFEGCKNLEFLSISSELLVHPSSALHPPLRRGPLGIPDPDEMDADAVSESKSEHIPVHPERNVPLTKVQWLRVGAIAMSGLQELQIPNVKFLVIQSALPDSARQEPVPAHSIRLPNLQVFHVAASHSEILAISAPELHTLCLQVSVLKRADADRVVSSIFHGDEGMWTPKTLSINAPIHDKHYETLYRRLPDLETLTVTLGDKPSETFYKTLKKRGILPKLLRFTIDFDAPSPPTPANAASTSTPSQMRTVRYPPLSQSEPLATGSRKPWKSGGSAVSNLIARGANRLNGSGGGSSGNRSVPDPLSDQVRPSMREVARVRAQQKLEFALLCCKYSSENLTEIYAEKDVSEDPPVSASLDASFARTGRLSMAKTERNRQVGANTSDHAESIE
ncbi:hypothetical protein PIIN_09127 [Serendipita indica DSM 11827]|uniref:F-box domain-containing protein n=1 Tax=Serendipita indica (strain DSM 11827) TaxID=1109443 RepID=G4TV00_SERID|nr:hypothetical protein PIIN_09127 [Serendipita indica DSM 11827]